MKVRNGFVSNSSSSSFVVAFDKVPGNVDELRVMLFGDDDSFQGQFYDEYPVTEVAATVWDDMQEHGPITTEKVIEEFSHGYIYEIKSQYPEHPWGMWTNKTIEETRKIWQDYEAARHKVTDAYAKKFLAKHPNATFYRFSYSDNDGSYFCAMEHGGLFDRLPHQAISHH